METKRRLGKGIEDISHFFLSPTQPPELTSRRPQNGPATCAPEKTHRVIGVTSQTAGVSGFFWSSRLALALSSFGKKVLLVDVGMESDKLVSVLDSSLIRPSLNDLLRQSERAISVEGPGGCRLLGFRMQLEELDQLSLAEREILFQILEMEEDQADIVLLNLQLDMSHRDILLYIQSLDEAVLVVSPEELLDSYLVLKALFAIRPELRVDLIEYGTSQGTYRDGVHRLAFASRGFLQRSPVVLGSVPKDECKADMGAPHAINQENSLVRVMAEIGKKILEGSNGQESFDRGLFFKQIQSRWHHETKIG
jgi:MinD-like ATPase involved in chromosome partitioning or flagellar assembly